MLRGVGRDRPAKANDARLAATLVFARTITEKRGRVSDEDVAAVRRAGLSDAEILDVVANIALTTFTNYLNEVAKTEIDFPVVAHHPRLNPAGTRGMGRCGNRCRAGPRAGRESCNAVSHWHLFIGCGSGAAGRCCQ